MPDGCTQGNAFGTVIPKSANKDKWPLDRLGDTLKRKEQYAPHKHVSFRHRNVLQFPRPFGLLFGRLRSERQQCADVAF